MPFWIESKVAVSVSHNLTISQKRYSAGISFPCPYDDFVAQRFACLLELFNFNLNRPLLRDFVKTVTNFTPVFSVVLAKNRAKQRDAGKQEISRSSTPDLHLTAYCVIKMNLK